MSKAPPLPKINTSGALVAPSKLAAWWPEPDQQSKRLEGLDKLPKAGVVRQTNLNRRNQPPLDAEQLLAQQKPGRVQTHNQQWVYAATEFLIGYVVATDVSTGRTGRQTSRSRQGLVSEALTRLRDDRVVQGSLGLSEGMQGGLEVHHRDVLSAVELLVRVDETKSTLALREGTFEPATEKVLPPKLETAE